MDELREALSRLDALLTRSGAQVLRVAHPGVDAGEVGSVLAPLGLTPTAELVGWFGWHDGAGETGMPVGFIELAPGCEFYGAAALAAEARMQREIARDIGAAGVGLSQDDLWRNSWFPILRLFGQGYVVADLASGAQPATPVHVVWSDASSEDRQRVRWPSIAAFAVEVVRRFEEGVYTVNEEGVVKGPSLDYP